ncbi:MULTISPECIES: N-acetylmuramic acid 6-phosphate etherase [Amycolatopsis]|uniref:N-acetylmuramic acid 6-phosphate etherase n=3 Tax=Amycolatopsis TaxID=1813 RepID=M2XTD3_9PSEU|nr:MULTISPECIES: N-acetylmuramic acid 6-phosphate etherase [Amycolatopsis]EME64231.1 N-acetylmuramic acid-6-phosphate etherase [Amycolatopsis decaplanina DSM 44594]OKJ98012.1 N-acetylmuramic acid-6-phosphate etherase [Amycolatopsis sp. CB00013]OLZ60398.1 N-acetylmuramic acid 6-phosphate etherase [Amycolatopsis keratiniphila subsp. nogabecina]ONF63815.1 N-acetylmuramic acid 6-phosphate etherase [Amycolatopsis keratiniphila subsp. keratiniphila]RSN47410.1 N-acetylmuramic acid 6-phosphate etheras
MMTVPRQVVHVDSPTEQRNPRTTDIDLMSTMGILGAINAEDRRVPEAVAAVLPQVARAVDFAVEALRSGHRVHYFGAGTSGRLATLDAAELVPTFNVPSDWFIAHHAGGARALRQAVEDAEDNAKAGAAEVAESVAPGDFVLGLTASGRTPYVLGALAAASRRGARTALVSGNPAAVTPPGVDVLIAVDTGPEAIAGSTRMKAGTAQKIILTAFSTATMIKLGRTYSNLMVSMRATNAKLRGRTIRILREATGMSMADCSDALTEADGDLKVALVHLLSGEDVASAAKALTASDGHVRKALDSLRVRAS